MLTVYLIGLAVGGVLIGMSALGGGNGDGDIGGDAGASVDLDGDIDVGDAEVGTGLAEGHGVDLGDWLPFRSFRFWTFFTGFGGLTGVLFTLLSALPGLVVGLVAAAVGYGTGTGAIRIIRMARGGDEHRALREANLVGKSAMVLLPVSSKGPGKVRVEVQGRAVDFVAMTGDAEPIGVKAEVLVYEVKDDGVLLVTTDTSGASKGRIGAAAALTSGENASD